MRTFAAVAATITTNDAMRRKRTSQSFACNPDQPFALYRSKRIDSKNLTGANKRLDHDKTGWHLKFGALS